MGYYAKAVVLLMALAIIRSTTGSLFDSFAKTDFFNGVSKNDGSGDDNNNNLWLFKIYRECDAIN